eukprot:Tbor_TRINITY_DN4069_c0_g1::TRINITY_DN4069_c0_g1_i1::g.11763::m.11763
MQQNKDSYELKEVTVGDLVEMCVDCNSTCQRRTSRVVDNSSRPPRGWEKEYENVANNNQKVEFEKCMTACQAVSRWCPKPSYVRTYMGEEPKTVEKPSGSKRPWWKLGFGGSGDKASSSSHNNIDSSSNVVTESEMGICINKVEDFTKMLFLLAHKPTKVMFQTYDPKTGNAFDQETGEFATRDAKPSTGGNIDQTIKSRWAGETKKSFELSRADHKRTEEANTLSADQSTGADVNPLNKPEGDGNTVRGTVPRW